MKAKRVFYIFIITLIFLFNVNILYANTNVITIRFKKNSTQMLNKNIISDVVKAFEYVQANKDLYIFIYSNREDYEKKGIEVDRLYTLFKLLSKDISFTKRIVISFYVQPPKQNVEAKRGKFSGGSLVINAKKVTDL